MYTVRDHYVPKVVHCGLDKHIINENVILVKLPIFSLNLFVAPEDLRVHEGL